MAEEYGKWRTVLPSTGVSSLDSCLSDYVLRCCDCRVEFGVSVVVWPLWLVEMGLLSEEGLLSLFNDILSMGLSSVLQFREADRSILLCMGIAGENYEIDLYGNGNLLADRVLQSISRRISLPSSAPVRTDGVLQVLEESGASLQQAKEKGVYRNRFTVIFDGQGRICI